MFLPPTFHHSSHINHQKIFNRAEILAFFLFQLYQTRAEGPKYQRHNAERQRSVLTHVKVFKVLADQKLNIILYKKYIYNFIYYVANNNKKGQQMQPWYILRVLLFRLVICNVTELHIPCLLTHILIQFRLGIGA